MSVSAQFKNLECYDVSLEYILVIQKFLRKHICSK